jgi:hypothetical protein
MRRNAEAMTALATSPLNASSPFTRREALARGLTDSDLRSRRYQRIFHGIYVASSVRLTTQLRGRAALLVSSSDAHLSHHTAVRLWGGTAPDSPATHVSGDDPNVRSVRQGIATHRKLDQAEVGSVFGLRVSTPVQAFIELASIGTNLVELVVAGDSLAKAVRLHPQAFVEAAEQWTGRGAKRARRAARLIREGVDSPQETRLRLLIVLAGLPEPEVNWVVWDEQGRWIRRYDMGYRDYKLVIEYDGRQHAESSDQWGEDLNRREELDDQNIRLYVVRHTGIYRHPGQTLEKIYALLEQRGAKDLPRRLNPQWSRYFPGRDS